jgi:hypothetical protein
MCQREEEDSHRISANTILKLSWFGALTSHLIPCGLRIHTPRPYLRMPSYTWPFQIERYVTSTFTELKVLSTSCQGVQEFACRSSVKSKSRSHSHSSSISRRGYETQRSVEHLPNLSAKLDSHAERERERERDWRGGDLIWRWRARSLQRCRAWICTTRATMVLWCGFPCWGWECTRCPRATHFKRSRKLSRRVIATLTPPPSTAMSKLLVSL